MSEQNVIFTNEVDFTFNFKRTMKYCNLAKKSVFCDKDNSYFDMNAGKIRKCKLVGLEIECFPVWTRGI